MFFGAGASFLFLFVFMQNVLADWNAGLSSAESFGLPNARIYSIITNILDWLLAIVGIVGIIGFVISGILYLTAVGDEKKIGDAKKAMLASIYGVIVALSGYVAIQAIDYMLRASSFF